MNHDQEQSEESDTSQDSAQTPPNVKAALQELLKHGFIEEHRKPALFRDSRLHFDHLNQSLEPLDLQLHLDAHRGLAFLRVSQNLQESPDTEWTHPLVRRHRFTLEQTLLIALLRQTYLLHEQEAGRGHGTAKIALEDLLPRFLDYLGDSGSDNRNESRLTTLLDQLKTHGIISEVDKNNEISIRPLIAHLADADALTRLLQQYQTHSQPTE